MRAVCHVRLACYCVPNICENRPGVHPRRRDGLRLNQSDIWQIDKLISARIAKPVPVLPQPPLPPHAAAKNIRQIVKRFLAGLHHDLGRHTGRQHALD